MVRVGHVTAILIAACLAAAAANEAVAAEPHGRAYLFRGLIGLIDWGMDELATRINRTGVQANIDAHLMWRSMADQAISDYRRDPKPITAIGHSIGGDAAVDFAERLEAAHVPVSLLVTYDPNRSAHSIPANVHRYINLYQSSNMLGGGDLAPAHGFHGNYASYNLKNRTEIIHVNLDKFPHIQELLAAKIRSAGATEGGTEPLRLVVPANVPIELWDSGLPIAAHVGDTLHTIAAAYHVPLWALTQLNKVSESAALTEGQRVIIPHYIGQKLPTAPAPSEAANPAPNAASSDAPNAASSDAPNAASSDAPN